MNPALRVFIRHKNGLLESQGGELDQFSNIVGQLKNKGISVSTGDRLPENLSGYDLIHYFNLDACEPSELAKTNGIPKALTPIFPCGNSLFLFSDLYEEWPRPRHELQDSLLYSIRRRLGIQGGRIARACRGQYHEFIIHNAQKQSVINCFDLFVPNSHEEMRMLSSFFCIDNPAYEVIPNGVDLNILDNISDYAERNLPKNDFILSNGGIGRRKNQYMLAKAFLKIDMPLVFTGAVCDSAYFESVSRVLARKKHVFFLGHLSKPDLYSVCKAAKINVLPSFYETPGIATLECVAHECVNVASTIGGLREYLGDYSLYCNPYSVDHIEEQLKKALKQPPNTAGAEFVRKSYSYDIVADRLISAYRKLLSQ